MKKQCLTLPPEAGTITEMAWSPDEKKLAVVTDRGYLHIWQTCTGVHLLHLRLCRVCLLTVSWDRTGHALAVGGTDGALYRVTHLADPQIAMHPFSAPITRIAWSRSPVGRCLVVSGSMLTILDERGCQPVRAQYPTTILHAAWSADGRTLAVVCQDGLVEVWNAAYAGVQLSLTDICDPRCVSWHRDGHRLAIGTATGHVQITDLRSDQQYEQLQLSRFPIQTLRWGERYLVACGEGARELTLWNETEQTRWQPVSGVSTSVCAFNPQGTVLATGLVGHVTLATL